MTVTKRNGASFATDSYGALQIEAGTSGQMKIVLEGTNLDIDELKAGVNFNGQNIDGTVNEAGTQLTIENVEIPTVSGVYPIKAQLKPKYKTEYTIVPDSSSYNDYKSKILRVLGEVVLKELCLSGYAPGLEGTKGWLVIKGENLDTLTANNLSNITSSLGANITEAEIKDSTVLKAKYLIPDLDDDSVIGKTETLTIAGKTVSAPLHTLKIREYSNERYIVIGYHSIPSDGNPRIPAYVSEIYNEAFKNCTTITNVDLSGCTSLTTIGKSAFSGCTELTSVNLPASLTTIDSWDFYGCTSLTSLTVDTGNQHYKTVDNILYTKDEKTLVLAPQGLKSVNISGTVTTIGKDAFSYCTSLTSAVFADTGGWAVYDNYTGESQAIQQSSLTNAETAATYLHSTYEYKYWKKN